MPRAHSNAGVKDALAVFSEAVGAVQADRLLGGLDWDHLAHHPLDRYARRIIVGMGKASLAMASIAESNLNDLVSEGCVVVPEGYRRSLPERLRAPQKINVIEGGHPVPDEGSRRAAREMLRLAAAAGADDLVIVLISGGGSSLCADFLGEITLDEARSTYQLLLESGADIHALNAVRKHISRIGGGRLAEAAWPAEVVALVVSDVVGDDLAVIASGPTTGDPSTYEEALAVLEKHRLCDRVPASVRSVLEHGMRDPAMETPKPGKRVFDRVSTRLIGTNETALKAAREEARRRGYDAEVVTRKLTGEARDVGRSICESAPFGAEPTCLLYGGETTVTVRGEGRGGRNQEAALAAAVALRNSDGDVVFLSGGTDGVDGPTDAAGAWATPGTFDECLALGLNAEEFLARNDSYSYFSEAGSLLQTGITHTNVGDVVIVLHAG